MSSSRAAQHNGAFKVPPAPESSTRQRACGRDEHFISRLTRLTEDHIGLALLLYRDAELIRRIFNLAHLQDVPRIAISLGHPNQGPFVIVTRHGHFVTCLGEGMSAWPLPIVPRKQLIAMHKHLEALRRASLNRG